MYVTLPGRRFELLALLLLGPVKQALSTNHENDTLVRTFVWMSDIHLDVLYDPLVGQDSYCRNASHAESLQGDLSAILKNRIVNPTVDWEHFVYHNVSSDEDVSDWERHWNSYTFIPAYHGRYGCDTPPTMAWAGFKSLRESIDAKPVDFVLVTGDLVGHYWKSNSSQFRMASMLATVELLYRAMFQKVLPDTSIPLESQTSFLRELLALPSDAITDTPQVILCPGNNDMENDYMAEENSQWNQIIWDSWSAFGAPKNQKEVFLKGMYYAWTVKKNPTVRLICLNSNWWSTVRYRKEEPPEDPADQFVWFEEELEKARRNNQTVMVVGHIPPAHSFFKNALEGFSVMSQWIQKYNERYYRIVQSNQDIIRSQLYGHFHTDQFRLQMKPRKTWKKPHVAEPLDVILLAPGICPNHGTNPAWRHVHYRNGEVNDYEQYSSRLYGQDDGVIRELGTWDGSRLLTFHREYSATERFGVPATTASYMFKSLWTRLTNKDSSMHKFWTLEEVEANYPPAFLMRCVIEEDYNPGDINACAAKYVRENQQRDDVVRVVI
eukprot:Gregarina_sp_Pseudo_9__875@NODE_155_length_3943_cov_41_170850_g142_i0_p1_GENE_NODE_155_length_3943_cov_41_170850_g142_i0NODE_155_length_3943_cov_41_170850_g142_i0_p1_ORF_typecomplete_len551_score28_03Metallophos/PF00149_28/1_4e14Metallophos/PF00149_28/9_1e03Metallophos_2/PF12850_7/3_1e03Metallophos_2/PF12850_7/0_00051_NODE_155_length_3943_cov_41_170850_g142_i08812533